MASHIAARASEEITEKLDAYCKAEGVTRSEAILRALALLLEGKAPISVGHEIEALKMRLEAIESMLAQGYKAPTTENPVKKSTPREAAPRPLRSLTTSIMEGARYDREKILALSLEKIDEYNAKGLRANYTAIAEAVTAAGLINQHGGNWTGQTLGQFVRRNSK
ncbi:ribbon-helix-helix CopG family protein [Buttiauxella sp. BIGb0552]|uniref:ribbon-helix-helix protein, CopG family n=1 Tax=Buttiauxella sp. BIGb0552 TaxID=2485120 RepID=UPI0010665B2D|nr:ribbon-helix-helix protein, CopG family [Buttiauxella sp. BIGb0552]TDX09592.1 ribbon-helix-helix CopG family protein [Buttiauxella sp. BIGb0552]